MTKLTVVLSGNGRSDLIEWMFEDAVLNESSGAIVDLESQDPGYADRYTGRFLEPTVWFITFVADSIMSLFSSIMKETDFQAVMVTEEELSELPSSIQGQSSSGATYTVNDLKNYARVSGSVDHIKYPYFTYSPEEIFSGKINLLDANFINGTNSNTKIRKIVSEWYQVLRMVTIVGLLCVLIYTGIKIILSSNSKDKAKYKEMIFNWIVATILAFTMHYIMAFILAVIEQMTSGLQGITGAIQMNVNGHTFVTNLMGVVRFQIQKNNFVAKVGNLVMYIALVTYTVKFTWLYFKRLMTMAFLTVISPIVALIYPIDKMDGDAKTFKTWLSEYIYNALLQPMHYILYYVLLSSSLSLAVNNPIYAIAVLMFMSQAEKILKRIFGFGKARMGTVGGIAGAFATGAITSKLIDTVSGGGSKKKLKEKQPQFADNYDKYINFNEDTKYEDNLIGLNFGNSNYDTNVDNSTPNLKNYDFGDRNNMLEILRSYQNYGGNLDDIPDLAALSDDQLKETILNRVIPDNNIASRIPALNRYVNENRIRTGNGLFNQEPRIPNMWEKPKRVIKGATNVVKTVARPVWDFDKGTDIGSNIKYNSKRIAKNVLKGAAGATIGVAAATVQAGISITDGKYNAMEGVTALGVGTAAVSKASKGIENSRQISKQDQQSLEKYKENWVNRDDVINAFKNEFPGEDKKMRKRAANNYVSRGITDLKEQKQGIKFANVIKQERGLDEEEADKIAVATLQYRRELKANNKYEVIYNKKKRKDYVKIKADAYTGAANTGTIIRLHEDLIDNVKQFDEINK